MSISIDIDLSGIEDIAANVERAQDLFTEDVMQDSQRYVPFDTGTLYGSCRRGRDEVTWAAEYANYVYNADHLIHGGVDGDEAAPHWFEHAKSLHSEEWAENAGRRLMNG